MAFRKTSGLECLIWGLLNAQNNEESNSPWNSLVFLVKKNSGKCRTVTHLRTVVNQLIHPMDSIPSCIS